MTQGSEGGVMKDVVLVALVTLLGWSSLYAQLTTKNAGLGPEAARKCAEQGDPDCQAKLGWFLEEGREGVKEDHVQAIKWYRRAAEQRLVVAEMALATTYEGGYHVPQDYVEAAKWYGRAAEQGDVDAQEKMAIFYWTGKGVSKDLVRAHMWANLTVVGEQSRHQEQINATSAGPGTQKEKDEVVQIFRNSRQEPIKLAIEMRDSIEREMTPAQIMEAQRLARLWKPIQVNARKALVK
jgi:hypothetical protein